MTAPGPSLRQLVEGMALGFDPPAGPAPAAVLELALTGDERGTWQLVMSNGACRFEPVPVAPPTLRVEADAEVWRAVVEGRLEPLSAAIDGRMRVEGDLGLFQRLPSLFHRLSPADLRAPPGQRAPGPVRLPATAWLFVALLPWKAFWILTAPLGPARAVLAATLAAGVVLAVREASGGSTFLERATAVVFAAAAAASAMGLPLPPGAVGASFLALGAIWAASVIHARHPLTGEYSRWDYSPRLWGTGLFRHPNALLTLLWSGLFAALGLLATAGVRGWLPHPAVVALSVAICAAGGVFTRRRERGARSRRVADLDASLARTGAGARLMLAVIAGGFVLLRDPGAPPGWWLAPAAALAVAALWPSPRNRAGSSPDRGPAEAGPALGGRTATGPG